MIQTQVKELKRKFLSNKLLVLYTLGALTGVIGGIAAGLFKLAITQLVYLFSLLPKTIGLIGWILMPVIGAIVSGAIVFKFAPEEEGDGIPNVMMAYAVNKGNIRPRVPIIKAVSSAIFIGSGGSCGSEAPIGQIGAGAGSTLAQWLKLDTEMTRTLVICGLSSGIAAIFNAPLGGAIFGLEILAGAIVGISIIPVILASVVAVAVSSYLFGASHTPFTPPQFVLGSEFELIFYLFLGLLLGVLSKVWVKLFYKVEGFFTSLKVSSYYKPIIGALILGVLTIIALLIESAWGYQGSHIEDAYIPVIMGIGYPFIDGALIGQITWLSLIVFGLMKMLATSACVGSGGSGGVFAPTLFIGAGIGGALGYLFSGLAPGLVSEPMAYALVGMAALFAGTAHAPITCVILIVEMSGDYAMMLPLMIAVSASYLTSYSIDRESIYTLKLSHKNIRLSTGVYIDALKAIMAGMMMDSNPEVLSDDMTIEIAIAEMTRSHRTVIPVIDSDWKLTGMVSVKAMQEAYEEWGGEMAVRFFIEKDFLKITPDVTMDWVLENMIERGQGYAAVVLEGNPDSMIGFVTELDVLRAYQIVMSTLRKHGEVIEDYVPGFPIN
ncbi:MAG: chloride channel protein [Candidatus Thorarchaeota archaeon]